MRRESTQQAAHTAPRLVLLTGPFLIHTAFVRTMAAGLPVAAVVRETKSRPRTPLISRALSRVRATGMAPGRVSSEVRAWLKGRREMQALGPQEPDARPAAPEYEVHDLNAPDGVALLRRLEPELLAVCGTGLLKPPVFEIAPRGTINLHVGLSPRYRGSHCVFWPLYNGEPEWIGITVHCIDAGIDAGPILLQRRPDILPDDSVESLVTRSLRLGFGSMRDVATRLTKGPLTGIPQDLSQGRTYRSRDLTPSHRTELESRLTHGYLKRWLDEHGGRAPDVPLVGGV